MEERELSIKLVFSSEQEFSKEQLEKILDNVRNAVLVAPGMKIQTSTFHLKDYRIKIPKSKITNKFPVRKKKAKSRGKK